MGNGKTDYGQSGGNGFPGIKRMFFIQKIGQGIVGFHGKCGNGFRRTRRTMNEMLPDFKANAYHSFSPRGGFRSLFPESSCWTGAGKTGKSSLPEKIPFP